MQSPPVHMTEDDNNGDASPQDKSEDKEAAGSETVSAEKAVDSSERKGNATALQIEEPAIEEPTIDEPPITQPSVSSPSTPVSVDSRETSNVSNSLRKNRVPRKKGKSGASEGENSNDELVEGGRKRPKLTGNLETLQMSEEATVEEPEIAEPLASSDSNPPSVGSSGIKGNLSNSLTARKERRNRKRGNSVAGDTETLEEGTKRPAYNGTSHTLLYKPDQDRSRNSGKAGESENATDEQNLVPGAFACSSVPSQDNLASEQVSGSEGNQLPESGTVDMTSVLAQEVDEEELETNRLENERLRREVSQMRRERDNTAVVVADEIKDDSNEGMSSTRKLGIVAIVLLLIGGGLAAYFLLGQDKPESDTSPESELPCISESFDFPLGLCAGDCDNDNDCADGLECFQREASMPVPGCTCWEEDPSKSDYCVKKNLAPIVFIGLDPDIQLALCQGDCDSDADCQEGLICYQRECFQEVPGCAGGGEDGSRTDFCVESEVVEPPEFLGECQGPCNDDSECDSGLFCFQRGEGDIPGCPGSAEGASTDRFCVKKVYQDPEVTEADKTPPYYPFGLCVGDCDGDTDCQEGLFCFQRESFQEVPGCTGGGEDQSRTDFCIRESYRNNTYALFPWGDRIAEENFGSSASLSADGQILVVGAKPMESAGYVNIYIATDSNGTPMTSFSSSSSVVWSQVTTLEGETEGSFFGVKAALSSDGRTLVVGSFIDFPTSSSLAARIKVFQATGSDLSNWTAIEAVSTNGTIIEMIGDAYDGDSFDFSVSISNDGTYVALGQSSNGGENLDSIQRGPLIFRKDGQDNNTNVMTFLGAPFVRRISGSSVAISTSSDGNPRVAAGGDNSVFLGDGQVRVMELFEDSVPNQTETEAEWLDVGSSIGQNDDAMVDLSGDGNFMALVRTNRTARITTNNFGIEKEIMSLDGPEYVMVYKFKKQGVDDYWDQYGNLIDIQTGDVSHMPTVALSDDGQVLAVGEPWVNENTGRVQVFKYDQRSSRWQPLQDPLTGRNQGELFGSTLSLVGGLSKSSGVRSATLAVGGPFSASNKFGRGSVECYQIREDSSTLIETKSQTASNLRGSAARI